MREFFTSVVINLSCEDFWNLRVDLDYDRFIAEADGQDFQLVWLEEPKDEHGNEMVRRGRVR